MSAEREKESREKVKVMDWGFLLSVCELERRGVWAQVLGLCILGSIFLKNTLTGQPVGLTGFFLWPVLLAF